MSHSSTNGVANFLAKSMIDLEFGFMGFFAIMQYISSLFFFFFVHSRILLLYCLLLNISYLIKGASQRKKRQ